MPGVHVAPDSDWEAEEPMPHTMGAKLHVRSNIDRGKHPRFGPKGSGF